jgi:ribosomal-protein-alanine N-acetyltransferase
VTNGLLAVHALAGNERTSMIEALARLHATAFAPAWAPDEIGRLLDHPGAVGLALGGHEGIVAFGIGRVAADEAEILTIVTAPDQRRKGFASRVLSALEDALLGRGAATLFLEVAEDNAPAQSLYRGAGFIEMGRRRGYYPRPRGGTCDALVLSKRLASPSSS